MTLTPALARLAAVLLRKSAPSSRGETNVASVPGFETNEAQTALDLARCIAGGTPNEHIPEDDHQYQEDRILMIFLADVLDNFAVDKP